MSTDINILKAKALVSVPFNKVRNKVELLDLYEMLYGNKLCRVCGKDREYAYLKLKQYVEKQIQDQTGQQDISKG